MATYRMTGPDGKTYQIEGPEGATDAQVRAKIQEQIAGPKQDSFMTGLGRSVNQGLFFGYSEEGEALIRSLTNEKSYDENLAEIRGKLGQFRDENPVASTVAEVAGSLPTSMLGGLGLAKLGLTSVPKVAATEGAIYGYGTGEGGAAERAKSAAVSSVVSGGLGKAVDKFTPKVTDAAKALMNEGIPVTPGQAVGGTPRRIEESLTSIPLVGDVIRSAEDKAFAAFNRTAMNKAINPLDVRVPKGLQGQEAFDFAKTAIDDAYTEIMPKLKIKSDRKFKDSIINVLKKNDTLTPELRKVLATIMQRQMLRPMQLGKLKGEALKDLDSYLGTEASSFISSNDAFQRKLGKALFETQTALRNNLTATGGRDNAMKYAKVRKAFSRFQPVRNASVAAAGQGGNFTPKQLIAGIKKNDKTRGKTKTASGKAPLQSFANQANETISRTVPNSGTADRALMAAFATNPGAAVLGLSAAIPTSLVYQNPVGRALGRGLLQAPNYVGRNLAPGSGAASARGLLDLINEETQYGTR